MPVRRRGAGSGARAHSRRAPSRQRDLRGERGSGDRRAAAVPAPRLGRARPDRDRGIQRRRPRPAPGAGIDDGARAARRDRTPLGADDPRPRRGPPLPFLDRRPRLRDRRPRERMKPSAAERWITIAPATLLLLAVAFLPMIELAAMSLSRIDWREGQAHWSWQGLANYARAAGDSLFHAGIVNTIVFALCAVGIQMVLGFALALATTKVTRGRVLYRTVFLLPILVPGIVIGAMWKLMYSFDFGVLNQMLAFVG